MWSFSLRSRLIEIFIHFISCDQILLALTLPLCAPETSALRSLFLLLDFVQQVYSNSPTNRKPGVLMMNIIALPSFQLLLLSELFQLNTGGKETSMVASMLFSFPERKKLEIQDYTAPR